MQTVMKRLLMSMRIDWPGLGSEEARKEVVLQLDVVEGLALLSPGSRDVAAKDLLVSFCVIIFMIGELEKPLSGAATTYIKSQPIAGFRGTSMGCTP
jgi:hypothetical protein